MSEDQKRRPPQTHEIEIDAPAEAVWKAISNGDEMSRWYVEEARVEPGVGGKQTVSWGDGQEMTNNHLAWEPGKRITLGNPDHETATGFDALVVDFSIETRAGRTVLKLVQSGLPAGADWDSMDEGTKIGWEMFLHALKFYLERHAGQPRRTIYRYWSSPRSVDETWRSLTTLLGLDPNPRPGTRYTSTAAGEPISGQILAVEPSHFLAATIAELNDALVSLTVHATGEGSFINFIIGTFALPDADYTAARSRWSELLAKAA